MLRSIIGQLALIVIRIMLSLLALATNTKMNSLAVFGQWINIDLQY